MPIVPVPLADQSNPGRHFQDGVGRLVNCYMEPRGKEGRHATPVYAVDGLESFSELPDISVLYEDEGAILLETSDFLLTEESDTLYLEGNSVVNNQLDKNKGVQVMIPYNGYIYAITGSAVFKVDAGGNAVRVGSITGSKAVTADINRVGQIGIVSDGAYFVCDCLTDTVTNYTATVAAATGFSAPNSVVHYNGYMVLTFASNAWCISSLNDATQFASADVATAIWRGDGLKRAYVRGGDLLLFGERSLEFWQDTGNTNLFTMQRVAAIEVGIGPPLSVSHVDEAVLFIDNNYVVRSLDSYKAVPAGTPFVNRKIREATDYDGTRGYSYERDGHLFYSITNDDFTLTYNLATGLWHEEKTYGLSRRVIGCTSDSGSTVYAGHYAEGKVYKIKRDTHRDGSTALVMEMETPPLHAFPNRIRVKSLFIDALFGQALAADVNADESDPQILVYISEDSGENWIYLESLSLGDINSKYEELRIQGVGTSDQNGFAFKLVMSTPVVRGILGMAADVAEPYRP